MAQQRPGFDMSKMSTASKILLGASALYVVDSFLPWNSVDLGGFGSVSVNLWHGVGFLAALAAILILLMEILSAANVQVAIGDPRSRALIEAGLAGAVLVFTILKVTIDSEFLAFGAWLGIILALAIAYGGWMRWNEAKALPAGGPPSAPPPPPAA
jgi:hypothetical protein